MQDQTEQVMIFGEVIGTCDEAEITTDTGWSHHNFRSSNHLIPDCFSLFIDPFEDPPRIECYDEAGEVVKAIDPQDFLRSLVRTI